jgi:hypothetical protein
MRSELQAVLNNLPDMAPAQLPELLGELEVIRATAMLRMSAPSPAQMPDEQLGIVAAAARLGVSTDYLYRHAKQLPFTRRMGRKLLFSGQGIEFYIQHKNSLTARQQTRIVGLSGR